MATLDPVNIGSIANDGTGDPLRDAFNKVNKDIAAVNNEVGTLGNNVKSGTTALLPVGVNIISFSSAYPDSNYDIVIMARDSNGLFSPGKYVTKTQSNFTVDLTFPAIITYIANR